MKTKWLPIESAPKDGTYIILMSPTIDSLQGRFVDIGFYSKKSWNDNDCIGGHEGWKGVSLAASNVHHWPSLEAKLLVAATFEGLFGQEQVGVAAGKVGGS